MESRCSLKSIKGEENVLQNGMCGDEESEQWRGASAVLGKWCVRPYVRLMPFHNGRKDLLYGYDLTLQQQLAAFKVYRKRKNENMRIHLYIPDVCIVDISLKEMK